MFAGIRPRTRDAALNLNQALGHKASALYALGDNRASLETRRQQLNALGSRPLATNDREVQEASAVVFGQIGIARLATGDTRAGSRSLGQAIEKWNELVALDPANSFWRGEQHTVRMWEAVALSAKDPAGARSEMASVIADQRNLVANSPNWVHKINLLRMISIDRALGGRSANDVEPLIAEAWSRRDELKSDERAVLAAVLVSEGDRLARNDRKQANVLWRDASQLLSDNRRETWTVIQRARVERRLGQPNSQSALSNNAFAGIFAGASR
jgi:hypothetical protein